MSKKLKELKEWATENVTLIKLLPPNDNLQVTTRLIDVLEDEVDEKYYLSEEKTRKLTLDYDLGADIEPTINVLGNTSITGYRAHDVHDANGISPTIAARDYKGPKQIAIREATKQGYAIAEQGDSVNVTYPDSKTRRGRVGKQVAQTLQAGEVNQGVVMNDIRIRKLSPLECWRLQGFTDEQFYKAQNDGVSNSQLYKQAGNAVTVNVVDAITKELFKHGLK